MMLYSNQYPGDLSWENMPENDLHNLIYGITKLYQSASRLERSQDDDTWIWRKSNGDILSLGKLEIYNVLLLNPDANQETFERLSCIVHDGVKPYHVTIPYRDFIKRQIAQYLPFLNKFTDKQTRSHLVDVFYVYFLP